MKKRMLLLIVLLLYAGSMVSCTKSAEGEQQTDAPQTEGGDINAIYYREEKTAYEAEQPRVMPEEDYGKLWDYREMADGDIYYLYEEEIKEQVENSYYWSEAAHPETERIPHIIRYCSDEDSFEEVELAMDPDFIPWKISVSEDGTIILFGSGYRAYVYGPGEKESRVDFPADPYGGVFFLDDTHLVCQPASGSDYIVIDIKSGEKTSYIIREFLYGGTTNGGTFLAEQENKGEQLLVTGNGIYEKEGEEWVLKVPSERTSMGLDRFKPLAAWKEDEVYCIMAFDDGAERQLVYRYLPTERTGETVELTLFSAVEDSFLKKAALEYQISHPEVTIAYTFAGQEAPETIQEMDTLYKRVNTEIISDRAADIYMLDWLPWEGYAEKGYLLDLDDALEPLLQSGEYFDGVLTGYRGGEGTFAMPLFFQADMVMGKNEVMPYTESLAAYAGYLEESPEASGLVPHFYQGNITGMFLPMVYSFYGEELYEEGKITEESLAAFLDGAKTLYDRLMSDEESRTEYYNLPYGRYHFFLRDSQYDLMGLGSGSMDLVPVRGYSVPKLPQVFHFEEYSLQATGQFHPVLLMGVHSGTEYPEEAKDFLRFLAAYTGLYTDWPTSVPGVAVNRSVVALWMETETAVYREGFGWDLDFWYADAGEEWPYYLPCREEDVTRVEALLSKVDTPAVGDANALTDPVYALLLEEAPGYIRGEKTLEKTVEELYGRLSILQSERK